MRKVWRPGYLRTVGSRSVPHTSTRGSWSVLWQDQSAGLQMRGADEVWREVPWRSNLLSIHLGGPGPGSFSQPAEGYDAPCPR